MVRVTIRPGMHHREDLRGGDVVEVSEAELAAFGDKFVVLEELEPQPEPEPGRDPWAGLDATEGAVLLAAEHGVNLYELSGTGAGGRILKRDVAEVIDGGA